MTIPDKSFGEMLKAHRIRSGVSQRAMANILGVDNSFLCLVEKGKRFPSTEMMKTFAQRLGCRAVVTFFRETNGDPEIIGSGLL
jgi:transcriptional regulator with XRE-family HTH domain